MGRVIKARGGSGVAGLPEDDLLGLVGKHPADKDKSSWIASLGDELGHAFGLPHPTDTEKQRDASMWRGIYGKYPDKTYLTADDKKMLRRSPFFYRENNEPVFQKVEVIATYDYPRGAFEQHSGHDPIDWTECKTASVERHRFEETWRDTEFIYLNDSSRGYSFWLPMDGGESALSGDGEKTWPILYHVAQKRLTRGYAVSLNW